MKVSRRNRFEVFAESIPHIVWLSAPDGSTDYVNERVTEYTGLPRQTNYGWGWVAAVHDADAPMAKTAYAQAVATGTPFELNYRIRRFDGQYRWHTFRALPIRHHDGEVERWVGTGVDVEERAELAERLRQIRDQTSNLLRLLSSLPPEPDSFRLIERAVRALRANALLGGADHPSRGGSPTATKGPSENDSAAARPDLSNREKEVLRLQALGYSNREMADVLAVSLRTIEADRAHVKRVLGVAKRTELVQFAFDCGLVGWDGNSTDPA